MIWRQQEMLPNQSQASFRPRHEMKFLIPGPLAAEVRSYASSFCKPDPMAFGVPPKYCVTTLQLDSPKLSLHHAKGLELKSRFKLRVRTYGRDSDQGPVFVEIKRKFGDIVDKSRARLNAETHAEDLRTGLQGDWAPRAERSKERDVLAEFFRLSREIDAGPVVRIRYDRECWIGESDADARITLDTRLEYQSATDFRVYDPSASWRAAPIAGAGKSDPCVILELKSGLRIPGWMIQLVRHFSLQRIGYCKYSEAVNLESRFLGSSTFALTGFQTPARFHSLLYPRNNVIY